mmetsp:Transcript_47687/g.118103  ORF Transcript_47687/g.118103 Transcript_47687/m.118103 type:complete len:185 (-) Transcript_47687:207-761(-)
METRRLPNILITGTPGTGKSTTAHLLQEKVAGLTHIEIGKLVKEQHLHNGWDEEYQSYILDEDRICDAIEDQMDAGGVVVDYHGADLFPERWFDLVLVLRSDNSVLYQRLENRGYAPRKLTENVVAEIMQVVLDEAKEAYREEIVVELRSNTLEDLESNVERAAAWVQQWCHSSSSSPNAEGGL